MGDPALPVGRYSPAPSIVIDIDRTENSVKITGKMQLYGQEATAARTASIEQNINFTWTH